MINVWPQVEELANNIIRKFDGDEARVAFEYAIKMMRDLYRGE